MFPFLMFVSLAALAMGVLNSMGSFLVPALAPALSNLVYILLVFLLSAKWGVHGLAAAVLAGGACQFALQWWWSGRLGVPLRPGKPDLADRDLKKMLALFLPYAAGLSLNQVNPVISRMLASFLQEGAISMLNYANRVIQLPLGLFVIAVSQAVLPQLSRCPSDNVEEFRAIMGDSLRFALFVVLPVTLGLAMLSKEIVHLLFFRGAFGTDAWEGTAYSLAMYSLGLPGMACSTVILRGLYARSLPKAALWVTLTSVAATAVLSLVLMKPLAFGGLALATSLAFTLSGWVGVRLLAGSIAAELGIFTPSWAGKMALSLGMTAGAMGLYNYLWLYPSSAGISWRTGWFCGAALVSVITYGISTGLLGFSEWGWIRGAIRPVKPDDKK